MVSLKNKLKRQFAGKPEQLQLDDFVLYLDENLHNCKPILDALNEMGVRFERHGSYFEPGTADEIWLRYVGERSWTVLT